MATKQVLNSKPGGTRSAWLIYGAVFAVVLALIGAVLWSTRSTDSEVVLPEFSSAQQGAGLVIGSPSAAHKVEIYADFLCPYCREFEQSSSSELVKAAAAGKLQVSYRPFQLLPDEYSQRALSAWLQVLAKQPQAAWKFQQILFENQPYEADPNKPDIAEITEWAKDAGVSEAVLTDLGKPIPKLFQLAKQSAIKAKIQHTPTVLLDGKELTGTPSEMTAMISAAVK